MKNNQGEKCIFFHTMVIWMRNVSQTLRCLSPWLLAICTDMEPFLRWSLLEEVHQWGWTLWVYSLITLVSVGENSFKFLALANCWWCSHHLSKHYEWCLWSGNSDQLFFSFSGIFIAVTEEQIICTSLMMWKIHL